MQNKEQRLILITGGARSGKSRTALRMAAPYSHKAFVATGVATDDEMLKRINKHRQERGGDWQTFEEPLAIAELVQEQADKYDLFVIDCLTFWISNLTLKHGDETMLLHAVEQLTKTLARKRCAVIIVTNEVGCGVVPENALARQFRDWAGFANQSIAAIADTVLLMVSGISVEVK